MKKEKLNELRKLLRMAFCEFKTNKNSSGSYLKPHKYRF